MTWLLVGVLIWVVLAVPVAVLVGRSIRMADVRRTASMPDECEPNVVAPEALAADSPPAAAAEQPWTGPSTVPFAPSRLPWGGDRSSLPKPRPPVIRHPIRPSERDPKARERDTGQG